MYKETNKMKPDQFLEGLAIAIAEVGVIKVQDGYVVLEAEDKGYGFEWTSGGVMLYSTEKWAGLRKRGIYAREDELPPGETMSCRDGAIGSIA